MSLAALTLFGVYLGVGFVLRSWLQWRRTGDRLSRYLQATRC